MERKVTRSDGELSFYNQSFIIVGATKVGKSSLFEDESCLFLDIDKTLTGLSVDKIDVNSWKDFTDPELAPFVQEQLTALKKRFLVFDVLSTLTTLGELATCEVFKYIDPSQATEKDPNIWSLASTGAFKWIFPYTQMGVGVVFLAHADTKSTKVKRMENKVLKEVKEDKLVPAIRPALMKRLASRVQNQFYIAIESEENNGETKEKRYLYTKHSTFFEAGTRLKTLPERIDITFDGYKNNAFKILERTWNESLVKFEELK